MTTRKEYLQHRLMELAIKAEQTGLSKAEIKEERRLQDEFEALMGEPYGTR